MTDRPTDDVVEAMARKPHVQAALRLGLEARDKALCEDANDCIGAFNTGALVFYAALAAQPRDDVLELLREARDKFGLIAGKPEWNEEDDGPEPYNPRWSAEQCRGIARQARDRIDTALATTTQQVEYVGHPELGTPDPDYTTQPDTDSGYTRRRVGELIEEGDGFWKACSGCQESSDGYVSTKHYPYSEVFRCQPGSGCRECGGIGVIWDDTNYEEYARFALELKEQPDTDSGLVGELERLLKAMRENGLSIPGEPAWAIEQDRNRSANCQFDAWCRENAETILTALRNSQPNASEGPTTSPDDIAKVMSRKWLDPECCEGGCQSLVWKHRYESAVSGRADFRNAPRSC